MPALAGRSELPGARAAPVDESRELYDLHRTSIYRFCLSRLGSREEAEDAVQSTFLRAHVALRAGVRPVLASAWLFAIARNVCRSRRRAARRRARVETPSDLAAVPEAFLAGWPRDAEELVGLEEALAAMPLRLRRALLLREWQGLSYRELADELGTTQPAVETLLYRARRELARRLREPTRRLRDVLGVGPIAAVRSLFHDSAAMKLTAAVATVAAASVAAPVVTHHAAPRASVAPHPLAGVQRQAPARGLVPPAAAPSTTRPARTAAPTKPAALHVRSTHTRASRHGEPTGARVAPRPSAPPRRPKTIVSRSTPARPAETVAAPVRTAAPTSEPVRSSTPSPALPVRSAPAAPQPPAASEPSAARDTTGAQPQSVPPTGQPVLTRATSLARAATPVVAAATAVTNAATAATGAATSPVPAPEADAPAPPEPPSPAGAVMVAASTATQDLSTAVPPPPDLGAAAQQTTQAAAAVTSTVPPPPDPGSAGTTGAGVTSDSPPRVGLTTP
jgi:RNA polymerase sigma-70 factor (ECF subfamily)